jgi:glycosyltransferase involved in cell wall biosynthesis
LVTLDAGPLFSVVVPSFNREDHIGRCLESLVRQSCKDFEVVVVDNASTDGTVDAVLSFDGRLDVKVLVNDSNRERSFSRNRGAEHARGVFVVFLDSDDELRPDSLELAAAFVEADPDRRFFFQRLTIVDESGATVYEPVVRKSHTMQRTLAEGNPLSCSGVFVERSLFLEHRFDEAPELVGSEDWHCWIRIAAEHEPVVCPGGGALLVDHSSRTISSDSWHDAEKRFTHLTVDLLADPATRGYLAPHIGLFHGTQAHYVAIKAAGQSAFRTSLVRFGRAIRHHPGLMFTRRTMHLFRLWLRGAVQTASRTRESE